MFSQAPQAQAEAHVQQEAQAQAQAEARVQQQAQAQAQAEAHVQQKQQKQQQLVVRQSTKNTLSTDVDTILAGDYE